MSLRVAILAEWFSTQAGYAENCLPKALASLGNDVHVITSTAQPYFDAPFYSEVYEPWLGPPFLEPGVTTVDGYAVHRLPLKVGRHGHGIKGLVPALRKLKPDIVQAFDVRGSIPRVAALAAPILGYKLFTGNHLHASVYPKANADYSGHTRLRGRLSPQGLIVGGITELCYAISPDAADIAVRFLGIPAKKVVLSPLGVDTDVFRPVGDAESVAARRELREELGFAEDEVVCIYTGRFTAGEYGKNPLLLAEAIGRLIEAGHPFRGLFVGGGDPDYVKAIQAREGTVVRPFVGFKDLVRYYWAAEAGVWPRQESTSQIDAAACGLPLVLSDTVQLKERTEGGGLLYREDDLEDLARKLEKLEDPELRARLGAAGAETMRRNYSWRDLAQQRLVDYQASLGGR